MSDVTIVPSDNVSRIPASDGSLTVTVAIRVERRSRRTLVQLPQGATRVPSSVATSRPWDGKLTPLQAALARAYRWLRTLEAGEVASVSEIARRERLDFSYVARLLNLTTLAPEIIAAILNDELPAQTNLHVLAINTPLLWAEQRAMAGL